MAIGRVEIERRRSGGHEHQTALFVEGHSGPVVGSTRVLPGFGRPSVVAELAGSRDGVKRPLDLARADVDGTDVAGSGREVLGDDAPDDEQVLVYNPGCGERNAESFEGPFEALPEVDSAAIAEFRNGFAGFGIESVQPLLVNREDAGILAVGPIVDAASAGSLRGRRASRRDRISRSACRWPLRGPLRGTSARSHRQRCR
jgi:hypothetical protein